LAINDPANEDHSTSTTKKKHKKSGILLDTDFFAAEQVIETSLQGAAGHFNHRVTRGCSTGQDILYSIKK
jgi:hypothetical protein